MSEALMMKLDHYGHSKKWLAVDLDGTLAHYDGWKGIGNIGAPVKSIADALRIRREDGWGVAIFTARVSDPAEREAAEEAIWEWLDHHGIEVDGITCIKHKHFIEFWDDRALSVVKNTGEFTHEIESVAKPTTNDKVPTLLRESADTFEERGRQYGYIYKTMHPDVFCALFPNGMVLKTHDDFTRFALINAVVGKLTRYVNNFDKGGHRDSLIDIVNFAAMLNGVDDEVRERNI